MTEDYREECDLAIKQKWKWKNPFQGKNMLDTIFITLALILFMENFR